MSAYENSHEDIPRFEPWLGVMASSIVPAVLPLYLPARYLVPLIVLTVALFLTSLVMLRRQTIQRKLEQMQTPPDGPSRARSREAQRSGLERAES